MTYTRDKEGYMLKDGVRDMRFKQLNVSTQQPEPEQEALWEADTEDEDEEEETYEVIEKPKPKQKKPRAPKQPKEKKEKKEKKEIIVPVQPVIQEESKIELPPPFPSETFMMKSRGLQNERKATIEDMSRLMRQRTMKLKF